LNDTAYNFCRLIFDQSLIADNELKSNIKPFNEDKNSFNYSYLCNTYNINTETEFYLYELKYDFNEKLGDSKITTEINDI